ncbi:helix-turn-helix domain-containing protein [Symbiopectobacterium purcellii]|uniref:helix-turn-helix domain-containing protein n=1 Tax=Symbiopectobacterium purcellii TaxID=2871826 RepID=UPI003F8386E1
MSLEEINTSRYLTSDTQSYMFPAMNSAHSTLSERLKLAMDKRGMSQGKLAEAAGLAQPTIWKILDGKTKSSGYIVEIAMALNVRPEWLALNSGPMLKDEATEYDTPEQKDHYARVSLIPIWEGAVKTTDYAIAPREVASENCKAYVLRRSTGFSEMSEGSAIIVDSTETPGYNDYVYAKVHNSESVYKFVAGGDNGFLMSADQRIPLIPVGDLASIIGVIVYIGKNLKR